MEFLRAVLLVMRPSHLNMASSLEMITIAPKGKHTATVIFMHVRRYRVLSASSSSDTNFRAGIR